MRRLTLMILSAAAVWLLPAAGWAQQLGGLAAPPGRTVACESQDGAYRQCRTGFRGAAVLAENWSQTRCVEGRNWGSERGTVWVSGGCRGLFAEAGFGGSAGRPGEAVRCESIEGGYRECRLGARGRVQLVRQLSDARCVQGRTWGQRGGMVWVNGGCRAEFAASGSGGPGGGWSPVGPGGAGNAAGRTITCSSEDGRLARCPWDWHLGRPMLVERLSGARCDEGYSWGMNGPGEIWVSQGCRARFGNR